MLKLCVCLYTNVLKSVVTVKLFLKPFQNFKNVAFVLQNNQIDR